MDLALALHAGSADELALALIGPGPVGLVQGQSSPGPDLVILVKNQNIFFSSNTTSTTVDCSREGNQRYSKMCGNSQI